MSRSDAQNQLPTSKYASTSTEQQQRNHHYYPQQENHRAIRDNPLSLIVKAQTLLSGTQKYSTARTPGMQITMVRQPGPPQPIDCKGGGGKTSTAQPVSTPTRICPRSSCGRAMPWYETVCPHCGYNSLPPSRPGANDGTGGD